MTISPWKATAGMVAIVLIVGLLAVVHYRTKSTAITSFEECVAAGNPVMEIYPEQCTAQGQTFTRSVIRTADASVSAEGNIRIYSPVSGVPLVLPLIVTGEARVFENTVEWRLRDEDGSELTRGFVTAQAPEVGVFGPFIIRASYPEPQGKKGTIEVFATSAENGAEIDKVTIPVSFIPTTATTVRAYFSNATQDPNSLQCGTTYPVTRRVIQTETPARAALNELLAGPTPMEAQQGFASSIPAKVSIISLSIADGVARVDFSEEMLAAASGSCRVGAIRSQIENTLKQFATVTSVEILIGGEANRLEP